MSSQTKSVDLGSDKDTQILAAYLATAIPSGVVYLVGGLGAGKTTLARYWLESLGVSSRIKSPTYTLVEQYELSESVTVYHLDLYRLEQAEDYLDLGLDQLPEHALMLVEWPDKGAGFLPKADLKIEIGFLPEVGDEARRLFISGSLPASITHFDV